MRNLLFGAFIALTLSACGTTVEKQEARYKRNMDNLQVMVTKFPGAKQNVNEQKTVFAMEYEKIGALNSEKEKIKALSQLNSRVESFISKLDPSITRTNTTTNTQTGKLNKPMGTPVGAQPMGNQPMGVKPMGTQPMGTPPMGAKPMGTPMGTQKPGMGTK